MTGDVNIEKEAHFSTATKRVVTKSYSTRPNRCPSSDIVHLHISAGSEISSLVSCPSDDITSNGEINFSLLHTSVACIPTSVPPLEQVRLMICMLPFYDQTHCKLLIRFFYTLRLVTSLLSMLVRV